MLKISEIERNLQELPLLPTVVVRLLALSPNDEDFFEKLLKLSQEDPTFALRIIKLANSAASGASSPITSLRGAVVRIGAKQTTSLITSLAVMRIFLPSTKGEKNLWVHAIQVAVASKFIAMSAPPPRVDNEQAYLCGLLHDIGRFLLFDKVRDELDHVNVMNWATPKELFEIEQEMYGFDHSELGWQVCKKWNLPEIVSNVVKNHHLYDLPQPLLQDKALANLIHIIQLADFFSLFMILNPEFVSWEPARLAQSLDEKCIQPCCSNLVITADQLQKRALPIWEESNKIITDLGIDTHEPTGIMAC